MLEKTDAEVILALHEEVVCLQDKLYAQALKYENWKRQKEKLIEAMQEEVNENADKNWKGSLYIKDLETILDVKINPTVEVETDDEADG